MSLWQRRRGTALHMGNHRDKHGQGMDDGSMEFTMDELREFLEGDPLEVRADPEFKEKLRRKLWVMVRARRQRPDGDDA